MPDSSASSLMAAPDFTSLADWRRRIADLYASVRVMASIDPRAAWEHWRTVRDDLYRAHSQSPIPAAIRGTFVNHYWPYDPAMRFEVATVSVDPPLGAPDGFGAPDRAETFLPISSGEQLSFTRIGEVILPLRGGPRPLSLFWMSGYAGGLFLPFRDATNGSSTYGAGRYLLDAAKSADLGTGDAADRLILDFNFAFQPSCAFDPRWSCPLAPPENRLDIPIEAGERI